MTTSILINNAFGKDDVEKAAACFVVGDAFAAQSKTVVFLSEEGACLATKGGADGLEAEGYRPVAELIGAYVGKGGKIWVSKACAEARGITAEQLINGAEIAGLGHMVGWATRLASSSEGPCSEIFATAAEWTLTPDKVYVRTSQRDEVAVDVFTVEPRLHQEARAIEKAAA